MARSKRQPRRKKTDKEDSEEENQDEPDPETEDYFHDEVDKYYANREKHLIINCLAALLCADVTSLQILLNAEDKSDDSADEEEEDVEEVMGLDVDDDDDISVEDDEDESEEEEDVKKGLPSDTAWGKKKSAFYHVDEFGEDIESDEEAKQLAEEEEEEAMLIQKRLAAALDEQDFDTADFQLETKGNGDSDDGDGNATLLKEKALVEKDLSKLSKDEKLEILVKDSPELFELLEEFREKLQTVVTTLYPLVQLARAGKIPAQGSRYLEVRHQLYLNYCINIGFYLLLKARQAPVKDHPVIGKLVQYRGLIKELESLDKKLEPEIQALLRQQGCSDKNEKSDSTRDNVSQLAAVSRKQKLSTLLDENFGNMQCRDLNQKKQLIKFQSGRKIGAHALSKKKGKRKMRPELEAREDAVDPLAYYEQMKLRKKRKKEEKEKLIRLAQQPEFEDEAETALVDGKRSITYEISKNKGLTPKKKKELRNPRVKHRKKFQKAIIKRKSQVRPAVTELQRYGGEATGVRSTLVRSVKIK